MVLIKTVTKLKKRARNTNDLLFNEHVGVVTLFLLVLGLTDLLMSRNKKGIISRIQQNLP